MHYWKVKIQVKIQLKAETTWDSPIVTPYYVGPRLNIINFVNVIKTFLKSVIFFFFQKQIKKQNMVFALPLSLSCYFNGN